MKKIKNELVRVQTLIESDRLSAGDDFINLVESDVSKLLKDFFDFNKSPQLNIDKSGGKLRVEIVLFADRIKNFNSLIKD